MDGRGREWALNGRGDLEVAESSTGVFGVGAGSPGVMVLCCENVRVCGDRKGAGAVHGIGDYPELEGIPEGHGARLSCGIQANPGSVRSFALVVCAGRAEPLECQESTENEGVGGI